MFNKEVIVYEDKIYWIFRKFSSNKFKEEYLQNLTTYWNCDKFIKHNPTENLNEYLFLRLIPEAVIVD